MPSAWKKWYTKEIINSEHQSLEARHASCHQHCTAREDSVCEVNEAVEFPNSGTRSSWISDGWGVMWSSEQGWKLLPGLPPKVILGHSEWDEHSLQIRSYSLGLGKQKCRPKTCLNDPVFDKWTPKERQFELLDKNSVHSTQIAFQKTWWF